MKKRLLLALLVIICTMTVFSRRSLAGKAEAAAKLPIGVVIAHLSGRLIGENGLFQLVGYFAYGEVSNVNDAAFTGEPSEKTARVSFRSDPFKLALTPNGASFQVRRESFADGTIPKVNIYVDLFPDRDFARPDSFSSGTLIGVLRPRNTQGILTPSQLFHLTGSANVERIFPFEFQGELQSLLQLPDAITVSFDGVPPSRDEILQGARFSVPFSSSVLSAGSFPEEPAGAASSVAKR